MKVKTNRDGAKWINITTALILWIKPRDKKLKFIFWKAPGLKKLWGFKNLRFNIHKYEKHRPMSAENLRVFIRFPFFYWHKYNGGWEFGGNNIYLWWHEARVK